MQSRSQETCWVRLEQVGSNIPISSVGADGQTSCRHRWSTVKTQSITLVYQFTNQSQFALATLWPHHSARTEWNAKAESRLKKGLGDFIEMDWTIVFATGNGQLVRQWALGLGLFLQPRCFLTKKYMPIVRMLLTPEPSRARRDCALLLAVKHGL